MDYYTSIPEEQEDKLFLTKKKEKHYIWTNYELL